LRRPPIAPYPESANCIGPRPLYPKRCYDRQVSHSVRVDVVAAVWEGGLRTKLTLVVSNQAQDRIANGDDCPLQRCSAVTHCPSEGDCYRLCRGTGLSERSHLGSARNRPQCDRDEASDLEGLDRPQWRRRSGHVPRLLPPNGPRISCADLPAYSQSDVPWT
jgi:hypothetical protein